ncbi:restriction endonuclease subunit S [Histophilus somni]|uniref:restriction endonuclease subunit S n=2 Tax=Histophilus somni TaxID=731 RepID=UPI00094B6B1D|nr:restriction endonuclease subunit S [Histophilus somni]
MNEKLQNVQWGEYRIGDLFDVNSSKKIFHASNIEVFDEQVLDSYPYVVRKTGENGIKGYIKESEEFLNPSNTLSFAQDTFTVFYQKNKYFTGNKVKVLVPKFKIFNEVISEFFVAVFNNLLSNLSWGDGSNVEMIKSFVIQLPTKDNKIDFEFMESFISELEDERIRELSAYLTVSRLDNYELSSEEKEALDKFELISNNWNLFKIQDIFNVKSSKKRFDANKVEILNCGFPYIVRMSTNNGIKGYLNQDEQLLNHGNTIAFGQDTATMFYQEKPYFTGDKIKILECRYDKFNKINSMFLISTMRKSFSTFSWGANSFSEKVINNQIIKLPTKNNEIDFSYMELLISAVQKLVIKDVVMWKDKKIEATKQLVGRN